MKWSLKIWPTSHWEDDGLIEGAPTPHPVYNADWDLPFAWNRKFCSFIKRFIARYSETKSSQFLWLYLKIWHPTSSIHKIRVLRMSPDHSFAVEVIGNGITRKRKMTGRIYVAVENPNVEIDELVYDPNDFLPYWFQLAYTHSENFGANTYESRRYR